MGERAWRRASSRAAPIACLLVLVACSASPDPIPQPTVSGSSCQPAPSGPVTQGDYALQNTGSAPVVITRVVLRNVTGISIVGVRVFVVDSEGGGTLVGTRDHYPPDHGPDDGTSQVIPWSAGLDVPGATLPAGSQSVANVVLGLVRDSSGTGRSDGLDVDYTSGGIDYTYHGRLAIVLASGSCS